MSPSASRSKERDAAIANLIRMACSEEFKKQVRRGRGRGRESEGVRDVRGSAVSERAGLCEDHATRLKGRIGLDTGGSG